MSDPGPSRRPRHPHPERVYTGPDPATLANPRSRSQADKYFARVANDNILPSRMSKALGFGGWFFGGGEWEFCSNIGSGNLKLMIPVSVVYMALFADFGDKEHVFSPVSGMPLGSDFHGLGIRIDGRQLRRKYKEWTKDMTTLSPGERSILGLDRPFKSDHESAPAPVTRPS